MLIRDSIYGKFTIADRVIIDLIKSYPMQRLRGVYQDGLIQKAFPPRTRRFTRYEHCIGCMLLLRMLGASLEEQVAGLLHDASHTAFAHTIDAAIGNYAKGDYQDRTHKEYLSSTIIPKILRKHGMDSNHIFEIKRYHLLERELPGLCADRLDYGLREIYYKISRSDPKRCALDLIVRNDEIIFRTKGLAKKFATEFTKCQREYWSKPKYVAHAYLLGDAIRLALNGRALQQSDFYKTDAFVLDKMRKSKNQRVIKKLDMITNKLKLVNVSSNPDYILKAKKRYVDPKFTSNGRIFKLSESDTGFRRLINSKSKITGSGMRVRFR